MTVVSLLLQQRDVMTDCDCDRCVPVAAGEPHDSTEMAIKQVEERWEHLNKLLAHTQHVVDRNFETKKFYSELSMLIELVAGYEKWVGATEKIADEAQEISRQLDQCKVRSALCVFLWRRKVGSAWCVFLCKYKVGNAFFVFFVQV